MNNKDFWKQVFLMRMKAFPDAKIEKLISFADKATDASISLESDADWEKIKAYGYVFSYPPGAFSVLKEQVNLPEYQGESWILYDKKADKKWIHPNNFQGLSQCVMFCRDFNSK